MEWYLAKAFHVFSMENYIGSVQFYANFNLNSRARKRLVLIAIMWLISQEQQTLGPILYQGSPPTLPAHQGANEKSPPNAQFSG